MRLVDDDGLIVDFECTVGTLDDAGVDQCFAVVDILPEFVGTGCDEGEAFDDLQEKLNAITWH